ncbi:MAG: lambda exonuclease family protein [Rikenellaceae bacterium]
METQHSSEWYRKRLGKITGSRVGDLMKSPRSKSEVFTDTAKAYIYQLAAEREMNSSIVDNDELFAIYLNQVEVSTKAMRWGNEQEEDARELYASTTGNHIDEAGLCAYSEMPNFGSSPDGCVVDHNGELIGCIEIKCPNQNTYVKYGTEVKDGESLKRVKPEYYWQCQSHMLVLGVEWCDLVVYCAWQTKPLRVCRINANAEDQELIRERVEMADSEIERILKLLT